VREKDDHHAIDEYDARDDGKANEPEPQEYVNLFVDDVKRQNAKGIVSLYVSGRTVAMEGTLCHAGENFDHRINAVLLVQLTVLKDFQTVGREGPAKKRVHKVHLYDDVQKVEYLTDDKIVKVCIVVLKVGLEILNQQVKLLGFFLRVITWGT